MYYISWCPSMDRHVRCTTTAPILPQRRYIMICLHHCRSKSRLSYALKEAKIGTLIHRRTDDFRALRRSGVRARNYKRHYSVGIWPKYTKPWVSTAHFSLRSSFLPRMEELPARVKEGRSANSANSPTGSIVSRGYFHVACALHYLEKEKGPGNEANER